MTAQGVCRQVGKKAVAKSANIRAGPLHMMQMPVDDVASHHQCQIILVAVITVVSSALAPWHVIPVHGCQSSWSMALHAHTSFNRCITFASIHHTRHELSVTVVCNYYHFHNHYHYCNHCTDKNATL